MVDQRKEPKLGIVKGDKVVSVKWKDIPGQTLERVLTHLEENDELFDYNVPTEMRDFSREGVQKFIIKTYSQDNFEVVGANAVARHIKLHDFVECALAGPEFKYDIYVKPGMKGIIKNVCQGAKYPLEVLWEKCKEIPEETIRRHSGENLNLLPTGIFGRKIISNKIEILAEARPGRMVESTKVISRYEYYVPPDTKGIVTKIDHSAKFPVHVILGNTKSYVPPENGILGWKYGALRLIKENPFDIWDLIGRYSQDNIRRL